MSRSILRDKSYQFALQAVKLCRLLQAESKEYILSKQLLRSGTAIGAILREAQYGYSKDDFVFKLTLSLKEANESEYWLQLLFDSHFISKEDFNTIHRDCKQIMAMLIASIKTNRGI